MKPKVSVIISNYNYAQYLDQCIASVLDQTYPNIEIIVVDDASNDGSVAVISDYAGKIGWFIHGQNRGQEAAINTGLIHCTGDFIMFLDSDDMYEPKAVEVLANELIEHPRWDIVFGWLSTCHTQGRGKMPWGINPDCFDREKVYNNTFGCSHSSMMLRRNVIDAIGYRNPKYRICGDLEWKLRLAEHFDWHLVKKFVLIYRRHDRTKWTGHYNEGIRLSGEILEEARERRTQKKGKVGYAFVVADLFHIGHLRFFEACKWYCDWLIVGVFTDKLTATYKPIPIIPYCERTQIIGALRRVDEVRKVTCIDATPMMKQLVKEGYNLKYLFHGDNWKEVKGREYIESIGGKLIQPHYYQPQSSTKIKDLIGGRA